jgi:hypothetical protein
LNRAGDHVQKQKRSYDVAVAYRICPKISDAAVPLPCGDDKYQLAEICLKSFKECVHGIRVKIWAILDGCPPKYAKLFCNYFEAEDLTLVELKGMGNQATFHRQIEILAEQKDSDVVYFAEDDYLYQPGQFKCMLNLLLSDKRVQFISPYDHLDYYTMDLHKQRNCFKAFGGKHWMTAASTCLTFLTRKETLEKTRTVFYNYKRRSLDCSVWLSLTKRRVFNPLFVSRHMFGEILFSKIVLKSWLYCWRQILFGKRWDLWVPIPAVATHLDCKALSPNVDWRALIQRIDGELMSDSQLQNAVGLKDVVSPEG